MLTPYKLHAFFIEGSTGHCFMLGTIFQGIHIEYLNLL